MIHYPIPPNRQKAYSEWGDSCNYITEKISKEVLSLPISPVLEKHEINKIATTINKFKKENLL